MSAASRPADVLFFVFDEACPRSAGDPLPDGYSLTWWRPSLTRLVPAGASGARWLVWAAFHYLQVFSGSDYSVIEIRHHGAVVHRSSLFPRYFRFPFMHPSDLQAGDTWTDPAERGRGLARAALGAAVDLAVSRGRRLWYLTTSDNAASVAVAERAGLRRLGHGRRRARFGLRILGAFELVDGPSSRPTST